MREQPSLHKYLPLTESTTYILLALADPRHGYAVMQWVAEVSQGTVEVGPGTLYGAFSTLEKDGLIEKVSEEDRRKTYTLTPKGQAVLREQVRRLEILAGVGAAWVDSGSGGRGAGLTSPPPRPPGNPLPPTLEGGGR